MTEVSVVNFPLIPFLLMLSCTLTAINLFIGFRTNQNYPFGQVVNMFCIYIFIQFLYILVIEYFFFDKIWMDRRMSFIFFYGPIVYFAHRTLNGHRLSGREIALHAVPTILFFVAFIAYAILGWHTDLQKGTSYVIVQSWALLGSLWGYSIYVLLNREDHFSVHRIVVLMAKMILFFVAIVHLVMTVYGAEIKEGTQAEYMIRVILYTSVFMSVLFVLGHQIKVLMPVNRTVDHTF